MGADLLSGTTRSVQDIAAEFLTTNPTQRQLSLLVELLAAKENAPAGRVRRSKRMPPTPLPQDWQPNEKHYEWAKTKGQPERWVLSMAEKMRAWAISKDERRVNWDQVLYTFMMKDAEGPPRNLFQTNGHRNGLIGGGYA